jgi:single-strand DNA-binding protein
VSVSKAERQAVDVWELSQPAHRKGEKTMYQTIIIVGNLGRDPEMRFLPSGQGVTNFSVATSRKYTNSDNQLVDETTWFRISVWGRQAETCNQYLRRGSRVLVEGRMRPDPATGGPRIWTRQDGTAGASFEVTASIVKFLSSRGETESYPQSGEFGAGPPDAGDDDIPF